MAQLRGGGRFTMLLSVKINKERNTFNLIPGCEEIEKLMTPKIKKTLQQFMVNILKSGGKNVLVKISSTY